MAEQWSDEGCSYTFTIQPYSWFELAVKNLNTARPARCAHLRTRLYVLIHIRRCSHLNPSNAEATFIQSTRTQKFRKPPKPCCVGTHGKALAEHSHMSTHLPGFQSFFRFFAPFCIGQISHKHCCRIRVKCLLIVYQVEMGLWTGVHNKGCSYIRGVPWCSSSLRTCQRLNSISPRCG